MARGRTLACRLLGRLLGLLSGLMLGLLWTAGACAQTPAPLPLQPVAACLAAVTPGAALPAQCAPSAQTLPFHWDRERPRADGWARFDFVFDAPASAVPALLLPRLGNGFELQLNGRPLLAVGAGDAQRHDTGRRPWLVPLAAERLQPQGNRLSITLWAAAGRGALLAVPTVGDLRPLQQAYDREVLWRPQLTTALNWMSLLMALMALLVWLAQREPVFAAFAVAEGAWCLRLAETAFVEMPVDYVLWGGITATAVGVMQIAVTYAVLVAVGRWNVLTRRLLVAYLVAWAVVIACVVAWRQPALWLGWLALRSVLVLAISAWLGWEAFRQRKGWRWLFAAWIAGSIVAAVADAREMPGALNLYPTWSRLALGVFSLALAVQVALRLRHAGRREQARAAQLRAALLRQQDELARAHQAQARLQVEQAMLAERQRVMRDMHDGLGAQLSALLTLSARPEVPREELQAQTRLAMDELRSVVEAMVPFDGDLGALLGSLRPLLERRLSLAGVELRWDVDELPAMPDVTPAQLQHLRRLLLEAATNTARHAEARHAWLAARQDGDAVEILFGDDGRGFDPAAVSAGHGLANMRWRAEAIGAQLTREPGQPGSLWRLRLPAAVRPVPRA